MGVEESHHYTLKRSEFLVISQEDDVLACAREVSTYFAFRAEFLESWEALQSTPEEDAKIHVSPVAVVASLLSFATLDEKIKALQRLKARYPRAQVLAVVKGDDSLEERRWLEKSGAGFFILHQEVTSSSKFYYLSSLLVHGTYLPVPVTDLFPGSQVEFNGYQKLPLNQKYLPVVFAGFTLSDKKYRRLESVPQIYIRRGDLGPYRHYIETFHDRRGNALKKRCRALMMSVLGLYTELMLMISFDAEGENSGILQERLARFQELSLELGDHLKECPDVWNVIAHSLNFQFCRYERGVYVLTYALYLAQKLELPNVGDVVLASLLADVGLLGLSPVIYRQLQKPGLLQLAPVDLESYQHHPVDSLNRATVKEIPLSNEVKSILLCTHERADEKGFPNQVPKEKLPFEAQLIQFCELLDRRVRANLQEGVITHDFVRRQVWEEERVALTCFNADFLDKIEALVLPAVA
jgi:hypothetical protein